MDVVISNLKLLLNCSKLNIFGLLKLQAFQTQNWEILFRHVLITWTTYDF